MDSLKHSFNFQIIRGECDKLVDEFVPELVETLSSEMNPDLVCTTAGLCNSGTQFNRFLLYSTLLDSSKIVLPLCRTHGLQQARVWPN